MKALSIGNIIEIAEVKNKEARPVELILKEALSHIAWINTQDEFSEYLKGNETAFKFLQIIILSSIDLFIKIDEEKYTDPCFKIIHHLQDLFLRTEFMIQRPFLNPFGLPYLWFNANACITC